MSLSFDSSSPDEPNPVKITLQPVVSPGFSLLKSGLAKLEPTSRVEVQASLKIRLAKSMADLL